MIECALSVSWVWFQSLKHENWKLLNLHKYEEESCCSNKENCCTYYRYLLWRKLPTWPTAGHNFSLPSPQIVLIFTVILPVIYWACVNIVTCQRFSSLKKFIDWRGHWRGVERKLVNFDNFVSQFPMDTAYNSEELQLFRLQWKSELTEQEFDKEKKRSKRVKEPEIKCTDCGRFVVRAGNVLENKCKNCSIQDRRCQKNCSLKNEEDIPEFSCENCEIHGNLAISRPQPFATSHNDAILLSLPQPIEQNYTSVCKRPKLQTNSTEHLKKSLVDQLIEDIDEITRIPFFDISLPKEVGIQIFSHLELKDLCACALVSKSWKLLAEDKLIWYRVGCHLGYVKEKDCAITDRANWKATVQRRFLEERNLKRNWKERICKLFSLEFERGESKSNLKCQKSY